MKEISQPTVRLPSETLLSEEISFIWARVRNRATARTRGQPQREQDKKGAAGHRTSDN